MRNNPGIHYREQGEKKMTNAELKHKKALDAKELARQSIAGGDAASLSQKLPVKSPQSEYVENISGYTDGNNVRAPSGNTGFTGYTGNGGLTEYEAKVKALTDELINREEFSYNTETDPLYAAAKKQYIREGKRATEDTLGAASAMTGGRVSSYAAAAATQAGDYYNAQFSDRLQDLYEAAYNKYLQEYNLKLQDLSANQELLNYEYGKTRDAESDRQWQQSYEYQQGRDAAADQQWQTDLEYRQGRDTVSDQQYSDSVEYQKLLDAWEQSQTEKEFDYNISADEWDKQYKMAVLAAQYGDYSQLEAMGIDTAAYQAMQTSTGGGSGGTNNSTDKSTAVDARKATAQRGINVMNTILSNGNVYYNNAEGSSHMGQYSITNRSDWNTLVNAMNTGGLDGSINGNTITVKDGSGTTYRFYYDTTDSFAKSKLYGTSDGKATGYYA